MREEKQLRMNSKGMFGLEERVTTDAFTNREIVRRLVKHVETNSLLGRKGWTEQLANYRWSPGKTGTSRTAEGWRKGVADRKRLAEEMDKFRISGYQKGIAFEEIFKKIVMDWGGITQKLQVEDQPAVIGTLQYLDDLNSGPSEQALLWNLGMYGKRIASVSKLYAMSALERWVIYDSRVAAALSYLFEATGIVEDPHEDVKDFCLNLSRDFVVMPAKQSPDPKNGIKLRCLPDWPKSHASNHARAFSSFVVASWICRAIAETLNVNNTRLPDGESGDWKAYHVEMVLFMLGDDLRKFPLAVDLVERAEEAKRAEKAKRALEAKQVALVR